MIFDDSIKNYAGSTYFLNNNFFKIQWIPDLFCNYSCSYCWPDSNSKTRNHLHVDKMISGLNGLKSKVNQMGIFNFRLSFAGGEPTVFPGFLDLIESYSNDKIQKKQTMNITTNLTQGEKWWISLKDKTKNLHALTIHASWHRESVGDVNEHRYKFLKIHDMFKNRNFRITIVATPSQFDDVYSDALFFRKHGVKVILRTERKIIKGVSMNHPDYSQDMLDSLLEWNVGNIEIEESFVHVENGIKTFYDDVEQAITLNKTDYEGWLCYAGIMGVRIKPNGDITRGFGCIDAKIGNITDDNYILDITPKPCITKRCSCASDMNIPKIKF